MVILHPNILEHDGKKTFAVLPYEEFLQVREELDDYQNLKDLREARALEGDAAATPLSSVRKELKI